MEGAGILTALALLLLAPVQWWQARAQKLRLLSPHELHLRRATQPLGVVAVLASAVWLFGARGIGRALAPLVLDPAANWLPTLLLGAVLLYGLASFVIGATRCWGVRSDGMLPVWAFFKFAVGVGGLMLLRPDGAVGLLGGDLWSALLWLALNIASVWCAAVGATRFVLLTVGGGNALARVNKHIRQTQVVMRPARRRSWWKFW